MTTSNTGSLFSADFSEAAESTEAVTMEEFLGRLQAGTLADREIARVLGAVNSSRKPLSQVAKELTLPLEETQKLYGQGITRFLILQREAMGPQDPKLRR